MIKPINFEADMSLYSQLKDHKANTGKSIKFMLNEALEHYVRDLSHAN